MAVQSQLGARPDAIHSFSLHPYTPHPPGRARPLPATPAERPPVPPAGVSGERPAQVRGPRSRPTWRQRPRDHRDWPVGRHGPLWRVHEGHPPPHRGGGSAGPGLAPERALWRPVPASPASSRAPRLTAAPGRVCEAPRRPAYAPRAARRLGSGEPYRPRGRTRDPWRPREPPCDPVDAPVGEGQGYTVPRARQCPADDARGGGAPSGTRLLRLRTGPDGKATLRPVRPIRPGRAGGSPGLVRPASAGDTA
jgi:hypothetical protein